MPKTSLKSKNPLASVIIQTKNEQKTIGKLLKILTKQTFKNFEIILVDDNSTDKTLTIVNRFSKELPIKALRIKAVGNRLCPRLIKESAPVSPTLD